jgi:hypothetical protein
MLTDTGVRCDDHAGEVFLPRCEDCDRLDTGRPPRIGFVPGSQCTTHTNYPLPCARCARDRAESEESK